MLKLRPLFPTTPRPGRGNVTLHAGRQRYLLWQRTSSLRIQNEKKPLLSLLTCKSHHSIPPDRLLDEGYKDRRRAGRGVRGSMQPELFDDDDNQGEEEDGDLTVLEYSICSEHEPAKCNRPPSQTPRLGRPPDPFSEHNIVHMNLSRTEDHLEPPNSRQKDNLAPLNRIRNRVTALGPRTRARARLYGCFPRHASDDRYDHLTTDDLTPHPHRASTRAAPRQTDQRGARSQWRATQLHSPGSARPHSYCRSSKSARQYSSLAEVEGPQSARSGIGPPLRRRGDRKSVV